MKNFTFLLSLLVLLVSCGDKNGYTVKGVYRSAPDNTVIYVSRYMVSEIDNLLVPFDSAVVKNGKFEFKGVCDKPDVCFVSSSKVIDGSYIVLEPGVIELDMAERTTRSGTALNDKMERFLKEKERVIAFRGMCAPGVIDAIAQTEEKRDSMLLIASLAGNVFDLYVSKSFNEESDNVLGHFILTQSVGFASPEMLSDLFVSLPECMHDKIYELKKKQLASMAIDDDMRDEYLDFAGKAAMETAVGRKYINFELNNIKGGKVLFSDVVTSCNYTVLLFWGSWNKDACTFLNSLESLFTKYEEHNPGLVAISLDSSVEKCLDYVSLTKGVTTHLCNPAGGSAEVASAYGVTGLPYALLINKRGTILLRTNSIKDIETKLGELFGC